MTVIIELQKTSQPIILEDVTNTYEKGSFYCIYMKDKNVVQKYPIQSVFRVTEDYKDGK